MLYCQYIDNEVKHFKHCPFVREEQVFLGRRAYARNVRLRFLFRQHTNFLYFELHLYTAYAAHYVYFTIWMCVCVYIYIKRHKTSNIKDWCCTIYVLMWFTPREPLAWRHAFWDLKYVWARRLFCVFRQNTRIHFKDSTNSTALLPKVGRKICAPSSVEESF